MEDETNTLAALDDTQKWLGDIHALARLPLYNRICKK